MKDQDIALSFEECQKVDQVLEKIKTSNYYEILELEKDADKALMKKNYYAVSKAYHPDRFFRKNLGGYKEKLEIIFNALTKAYNTLSDEKLKKEYDSKLQEQQDLQNNLQKKSTVQTINANSINNSNQPNNLVKQHQPIKVNQVPQFPSQSKQPLFITKLQKQLEERLIKSKMFLKQAKDAMSKKDLVEAFNSLQTAKTYDPNNVEIIQLFAEVSEQYGSVKAEEYYQKAMQEVTVGNREGALHYFKLAIDLKPQKGYYYFKPASLFIKMKQSKQAIELLKKACELEPKNTDYLMTLAKVYENIKQEKLATETYQGVLEVDKSNALAKEAIRRLAHEEIEDIS